MPEGGFLEQKPRSPTSLALVIVAHAVVLTALALSKMEAPRQFFTPIEVKHIPNTPPPPEIVPEPPAKAEPRKSVVDAVEPIVPQPPRNDVIIVPQPPLNPPIYDPFPSGQAETQPLDPPKPAADPVRTEAQMDRRSELQPPYPAVEERMGNEGSVVVRLTIGADGRVKAVEKVSASSDAFWRATERHALRRWRFKPATLDGKPVESSKTVTVRFHLQG